MLLSTVRARMKISTSKGPGEKSEEGENDSWKKEDSSKEILTFYMDSSYSVLIFSVEMSDLFCKILDLPLFSVIILQYRF